MVYPDYSSKTSMSQYTKDVARVDFKNASLPQ